jgi:hypothetical protein
MWVAQFFIWSVHLIYGCFTYYWQGQYAFQVSYLGRSVYGFSVACNIVAGIASLIAAGLYGNIGIKVFYNNILIDLFNAPPLSTKAGKYLYRFIVPLFWTIAFVIAASIPAYFSFLSIIASVFVVQFSYSLPPLLHLGFAIQANAIRSSRNEGFDPTTGEIGREDDGLKR